MWFVAQPDSDGPGLGFDGAHRQLEQPREDWDRAALDENREYDHDAVKPFGLREICSPQEHPEQDRHRTLEAGDDNEHAFVAGQPDRNQTGAHPQRTYHQRQGCGEY